MRIAVPTLVLFALLFADVSAQRTLTPRQEERAVRFAKAFEHDLTARKDVGPIFDKYFAADFFDRQLSKSVHYSLVDSFPLEVARKLDRALLRRFYIALLNREFLETIYAQNRFDLIHDTEGGEPPELYPAGVWRLLKTVYPDESSVTPQIDGHPIRTDSDLRRVTTVFEQISRRYRKALTRSFLKANAEQYRRNLIEFDKGPQGRPYKPTPDNVFANGRVKEINIRINTHPFQLLLLQTRRSFRIINVAGPG
jgi:hypothetical protein